MKKSQLQQYRDQLFELGRDLAAKDASLRKEALRGLGEDTRANLSKVPIHLGDLSSDSYEQEVSTQLLANEREMVREIADALERIDGGTFGKCETCGEAISAARLQAIPYARHCIDCARKQEEAGAA